MTKPCTTSEDREAIEKVMPTFLDLAQTDGLFYPLDPNSNYACCVLVQADLAQEVDGGFELSPGGVDVWYRLKRIKDCADPYSWDVDDITEELVNYVGRQVSLALDCKTTKRSVDDKNKAMLDAANAYIEQAKEFKVDFVESPKMTAEFIYKEEAGAFEIQNMEFSSNINLPESGRYVYLSLTGDSDETQSTD